MFVKLFTGILDSSIASNRTLRHFFTDLLLCADAKGYVIMTKEAIAKRTGASLKEVEWGLKELQKPDPLSKTPGFDGKRVEPLPDSGYGWRIINYEAYRDIRDADQLREVTRKRVQRYREKQGVLDLAGAESYEERNTFKEFVDAWVKEWKSLYGFDYKFDGGKDGRSVKELMSMNIEVEDLISIAKQAWRRAADDKFAKDCKQAATIHGFRHALNQIRVELKNGTNPKSSQQRVDRSQGTTNAGASSQYRGVGKVARD